LTATRSRIGVVIRTIEDGSHYIPASNSRTLTKSGT
jgi:hypothetical protein